MEKSTNLINTRQEIAKAAGVSDNTIAKVEKIEQKATPEIRAAVKAGDLSISAAYDGGKAGATTVDEVTAKKQKVEFNGGNNERYTPADIIDDARKVLGTIDLDPASSALANETVKAGKIYTAEDDGLAQEWFGNIWLNPPYSKDLLTLFVDKLITSNFTQAIVLVINSTDTKWFAKLISKASAVVFSTGRIVCKSLQNTCRRACPYPFPLSQRKNFLAANFVTARHCAIDLLPFASRRRFKAGSQSWVMLL